MYLQPLKSCPCDYVWRKAHETHALFHGLQANINDFLQIVYNQSLRRRDVEYFDMFYFF